MAGSSSSSIDASSTDQIFKIFAQKFRLLRELSKSGIVALVLISVFGGYLLGHPLEATWSTSRLLMTLVGIFLLASGSSALNQLQEKDIDARMKRTSARPIPSGRLSTKEALGFVFFSCLIGLWILYGLDPKLFYLGLTALFSYNVLYTLWWKKYWAFAAVPGAIPGALPILMGYAAASGEVLSLGGLYLFGILFFWQMPHFWVLALKYKNDYASGGVPTLSVAKGREVTVFQITLWCLAYVGLISIAPLFLPVGTLYLVFSLLVNLKILLELQKYRKEPDGKKWLSFFLWINFSLILVLVAAVIDSWSVFLWIPFTR